MSSQSPRSEIPALLQEQLALGQLSDARVRELEREFGTRAVAEARASIERSNAALRDQLPDPATFAQRVQVRRAAREPATSRLSLWAVAPVLAAGAALVVTLGRAPAPDTEVAFQEAASRGEVTERTKGLTATLNVYRKRGAGEAEQLVPGATAGAHDVLQLGYTAAGKAYGMILSIDGHGVITPHLPSLEGDVATLEAGAEQLLPEAYELDDAPRFERFFFVTSERPFDGQAVSNGAKALARDPQRAEREPLELPEGLEQTSFLVVKETP